ncbi:MAG: hypothetical protein ACYTGQ_07195 [Planctomycetota bacterium]|jgi:hypothetical protein
MSRLFFVVFMLGAPACVVHAQLSTQDLIRMGYEPVQRTVDDVDPLRKNLKKIEPGLANPGQSQGQTLWRKKPNPNNPNDPNAGKLYLFTRGQIVEYDRSRYGVTRRGQIVPLRPDNLKFHIGAPMDPNATGDASAPASVNPHRIQGLDASVSVQPIRPQVASGAAQAADGPAYNEPSQRFRLERDRTIWVNYDRIRQTHHQGVLNSLDRVLGAMGPAVP